jgi:hypothetical protein
MTEREGQSHIERITVRVLDAAEGDVLATISGLEALRHFAPDLVEPDDTEDTVGDAEAVVLWRYEYEILQHKLKAAATALGAVLDSTVRHVGDTLQYAEAVREMVTYSADSPQHFDQQVQERVARNKQRIEDDALGASSTPQERA